MVNNVFILSMGRSGTTLLQNILDAHPTIVSPPESFFMLHLYTKYKNKKEWSEKDIAQFIDDLYTDRPFRLVWKIERMEVEAAFEAAGKITSFADACNAVRTSFHQAYKNDQLEILGDKKPSYTRFTKRIMRVHPNAKVIHMIRDPRGTANGHINTFKRSDVLAVGILWNYSNLRVKRLSVKYPDQYCLLKYEDLVNDPDKTIRELCTFLNIDFSDEMLAYRERVVERFEGYTEHFKDKHRSLLKPIDPSIAEKWKTSMTPHQIRQIEYTTHRVANQFGYFFDHQKPTFGMLVKKPFSYLKLMLAFSVVKIYFAVPFAVRKWVLKKRSERGDHKFQT